MTTDNNLVLGDDHPIFSEPVVDDTQVDESIDESANQEDISQYLVTLDRRNFESSLHELLSKEAELRNIYNRDIGNNAARKYQPRIRELEGHLDTYRQLFRREQYSNLTQEEINNKFKSDPNFARSYAEAAHFQGQEPDTSVNTQAIANQVALSTRSILTSGMRQGLSDDDIKELGDAIVAGKYDVDETGNPLDATQWQDMLDSLQTDVTNRIIAKRTVIVPPEVTTNSGQPVTHADTARPDMSSSGSRGVRTTSITMRNFRALPIEEQLRMFPNDGDIEKAVADGRILVEGLER